MFSKIVNKGDSGKMKSWYDLSYEEAFQLEKEFISHDMGKDANHAMHICILIGIFTFVFSSLVLVFLMLSRFITPYNFTILILLIFLGILIVVGGTIEYHIKFNSWLKIAKNIIKK